ncbi:substrate-binding domain-containing protein [Desulfolithobacter sp.]
MFWHNLLFPVALTLVLISSPVQASETLMMATTTSTDNTGLLDYLAPVFTEDTGITLRWVAVGTGKALQLGRNCDVDILLVHAPAAEKKFVENGFGTDRKQVMYNDFVIIGPQDDPVGIKGLPPGAALIRLRQQQALFLSRGDNSGTNKKECALWRQAVGQVPERESWYLQTGQGMLATITMAAEKQGYTLTDRGTWIKYMAGRGADNHLAVLVEDDPGLFNQYSVITINKERCPETRTDLAARFTAWITSNRVQALIRDFRLLGQPLFIPNAK